MVSGVYGETHLLTLKYIYTFLKDKFKLNSSRLSYVPVYNFQNRMWILLQKIISDPPRLWKAIFSPWYVKGKVMSMKNPLICLIFPFGIYIAGTLISPQNIIWRENSAKHKNSSYVNNSNFFSKFHYKYWWKYLNSGNNCAWAKCWIQ